ncbi:hypothetical protein BHE74_00028932 [Ensete ventricosum]|nr:hypothetical protein BHE74_00028932 [Ensete ventricosum]
MIPPYQAVHTCSPVDWYTNRPLPGDTVDWGCFRPITAINQLVMVDFDRYHPLPGGISRGRRKKREKRRKKLEIRCRSPSTIPIRHRPPSSNAVDEMSPPRLRR